MDYYELLLHIITEVAVAVYTIAVRHFPVQISVVVWGQYDSLFAERLGLCSVGTVQVLQWAGKGEGDQAGRSDLEQHRWHHCTAHLPAKGYMLALLQLLVQEILQNQDHQHHQMWLPLHFCLNEQLICERLKFFKVVLCNTLLVKK